MLPGIGGPGAGLGSPNAMLQTMAFELSPSRWEPPQTWRGVEGPRFFTRLETSDRFLARLCSGSIFLAVPFR